MICPYCGKEIVDPWREHFFPKSQVNNDWDFLVCAKCNHIKREHIVYPVTGFFKRVPWEFSFPKFENLWKRASMDKYLSIVPASAMRASFDEGRWLTPSKMFTVEERIFYGLDRLKEIYEWADDVIATKQQFQALVMSYARSQLYLLHTDLTKYQTRYPEVKAVTAYDYARAKLPGALIIGSAKYGVWGCTTSYKQYFKELLSAPSSLEMMQRSAVY